LLYINNTKSFRQHKHSKKLADPREKAKPYIPAEAQDPASSSSSDSSLRSSGIARWSTLLLEEARGLWMAELEDLELFNASGHNLEGSTLQNSTPNFLIIFWEIEGGEWEHLEGGGIGDPVKIKYL
jgi:hypothetical protein